MSTYLDNLLKAKNIIGSFSAVGEVCGGLSGKAVMKWRDKGRPPRTEYTGETNYAELISAATGNKVSVDDLRPSINKTKAA